MTVTPKKLVRAKALQGLSEKYTTPENKMTQIAEITVVNNSRSAVWVSIYVGDASTNSTILKDVKLRPGQTALLSDCKIIMTAGEKLSVECKYAVSISDGSIIVTAFGIEEDVS